MTEVTTSHHTVIVRRTYDAPVERVFRAWADPKLLQQWYTPGDGTWTARVESHEFRVGGRNVLRFGPKGEPPFFEDCRFEDIVPERRLCYAMTISRNDKRMTTSMVTVELKPRGARTDVIVTDQLVILDGGDLEDARERGWGETLDKLPNVLKTGA